MPTAGARNNLRAGIASSRFRTPPFQFARGRLDYQIESDYAGLIAPGMPAVGRSVAGEKFGAMNLLRRTGLYGGQFVARHVHEAFFEKNPAQHHQSRPPLHFQRIVQYYECISDVLRWHAKYPDDWMKVWRLIDEKYRLNAALPSRSRAPASNDPFDIDAKINGAYVAMGLLYGEGESRQDDHHRDPLPVRTPDSILPAQPGILFTSIGFGICPRGSSLLWTVGKIRADAVQLPDAHRCL